MKAKNKSKSLGLAAYFGIVVVAIIIISLVFKGIDLVRQSKFDGKHQLSVALISQNNSQIISINPEGRSVSRVDIEGASDLSSLKRIFIPIDAYVQSQNFDTNTLETKTEFLKIFLSPRKNHTDLTFIDLLALSFYSFGIKEENVEEETVSIGESAKLDQISSSFFKDPEIVSEKISIQVTNTTQAPGLGNKVAKYISNLGGVVVLVNNSHETEKESKIIFESESYTVKKLSKAFGIPRQKGEGSALADVIIVIGQDKADIFK